MRTRLLAVAASSALVLVGCGGNPEPKSLPSESVRPSASASASATPPALPDSVKVKSRAGAEAAVRHFLDALAFAGASGDTGPFAATYAASCTKCEAITKGIRSTYDAGGSLKGGAWRPTELRFQGIKGDVAYIDAIVDYEPQTWVKDSSGTTQTSPARKNVLKAFQLVWKSGMWTVGALDPEA